MHFLFFRIPFFLQYYLILVHNVIFFLIYLCSIKWYILLLASVETLIASFSQQNLPPILFYSSPPNCINWIIFKWPGQ